MSGGAGSASRHSPHPTAAPPQGAPRVGFVGLGRMGLPMAVRLAASGLEVTAADLGDVRRAAAEHAGLPYAPTAAAAAGGVDLLITVLPGPEEVIAAAGELIRALPADASWIEMSTATPAVARELSARTRPRGVRLLDAPVGGGPDQARDGELLAFVGGSSDDLHRWRSVLEVLAGRIVHAGPAGSGYAVKLLVNALWFTQAAASAEALSLGRRMGFELGGLRAILAQSAAASRFLDADAVALLDGDDLAAFSLRRCCEELISVLELGAELDVPLELMATVSDVHLAALARYGDVDGELLGARHVGERAGVTLRRG